MTSPPDQNIAQQLRKLPSVHELLALPPLAEAATEVGRGPLREAVRTCLDNWRAKILSNAAINNAPNLEQLTQQILELLSTQSQKRIRRVINATGILLHTGLGRAPLATAAVEAAMQAVGYCNLEVDLPSGQRSKRHEAVAADLCALTGAEAALVVNNNAGATGLVLAALAGGRQAIVSHGQLVEIGGGFRLPDVFRAYGATLRAIGTTNRTSLQDYESAINDHTGAILVVHTSNYQVVGFAQQPPLQEIVQLGKKHHIPVIHDVGSGALIQLLEETQQQEPVVQESVAQDADLVLFSGDKLLGGPQAGIIVGKRNLVQKLAKHPISRALRIDKLTLAALQATLKIYRQAESSPTAYQAIPLIKMLRTEITELQQRAQSLATHLANELNHWTVAPEPSQAYVGGGSMPGNAVDSWSLILSPKNTTTSVTQLAQRLRTTSPAIFGRIHQEKLYFDLRGVDPQDDESLLAAIIDCTT